MTTLPHSLNSEMSLSINLENSYETSLFDSSNRLAFPDYTARDTKKATLGRFHLERETRLELATPTLARLCSTTELFPRPGVTFYSKSFHCQPLSLSFFG
jgi:hypothetical protein